MPNLRRPQGTRQPKVKIRLLGIGTKMPAWVETGVAEYSKRLPPPFQFECVELPLIHRGKNADTARIVRQEGESLLSKIQSQDYVVALDVKGKALSTEKLAERLADIRDRGAQLSLLVGGPDGLSDECLSRADEKWSLSALTLPHPLVRIVVAEQIYRGWSVLAGHPYHRA